MSPLDAALRVLVTSAHLLMRGGWFVTRPKTRGAHAIALTPENRLIFVKLRYAPGWRVPGGGRRAGEDALEAALRELREEIGMVSHGRAQVAADVMERVNFKQDSASVVIVRDVRYRPRRWSLEVERVCEAPLDRLPDDLSEPSRRWIESLRPML